MRAALRLLGFVVTAAGFIPRAGAESALERSFEAEPPKGPLDVGLTLGLSTEIEFVNVQGKGGFRNRDASLIEPENRSPYMQIDQAVLAPQVTFRDWGLWVTEFRSAETRAWVDRTFLQLRKRPAPSLELFAELGRNNPIIARNRRTEAYPIIGTAFWKGREMHAVGGARWQPGPLAIQLLGSAASKRPLETDDLAEDRSFKILAAGDTQPRIGNEMEYGGLLRLSAYGVEATGFGFTGKLIDKSDIDRLDQSLNDYRTLGRLENRTHYWYGGRLSFSRFGGRILAEAIEARDGHLPRRGWYAEASFNLPDVLPMPFFDQFEPIVRVDQYEVRRLVPDPRESTSWDRSMQTVGLLFGRAGFGVVRIEYYFMGEKTGGGAVDDNQLLVQLDLQTDVVILGGSQ